MIDAPLTGLRVLETATGVAGPYAGRLLAMLGATVVKVEPPDGDPARHQQIDDEPLNGTSPLFVHLNAGKANVDPSAIDPAWAQVVIDDRVRTELDPAELADRPTGQRLISVTPWGIDGPRRGRIDDELIVQAQSGFLGFNRDPDGPPLRLPGWPAQYMAGSLAATAALASHRLAAEHIEVSWLAAFLNSVELCYADALHCERPRVPVGPHPPSAFPSGAIPCADGFVTPGSLRAIDWEMQFLLYGRADLVENKEFFGRKTRPNHVEEIWDIIRPWYAERTKREIFQNALDTPWAVGMVMSPTDALADEHLLARDVLQPVTTPDGPTRAIGSVWRGEGLPVANQALSARAADPAPAAVPAATTTSPASPGLTKLDGLRVIEMTVAWAGPYVGNLLSPLGADVIKIEAQAPFDGWRAMKPYDHGMRPGLEDLVADNRWFEASGFFNALNRGKRGCILSLATDEGRAVFLDLVASADAIVANFSAHVLPQLGLDWPTLQAANPGLVVVRMPAFGVEGPYSDAAGYGSIVEAMGGIGHRQGYEHEGARISNIYYPDPVAGVHAAVALLAGIHRRDRTGAGLELDLSHQEATWSLHGDALVLADRDGRDVGRVGNRQPGCPVSAMVAAAEGRWVAVVGDEAVAKVIDEVESSTDPVAAEELIERVERAGGTAVIVLDPWTAPAVDPVLGHLETVDHPITGPVRHIASPFRIDGARPPTRGPAPLFDQHTDEVIAEFAGYDAERLAALREAEVIGGELPPPSALGLG